MPRARSAHNWLDATLAKERSQDLIDQLLPNGTEFALIAGRPGTGKTNLALQLSLCLATGQSFLGFSCCQCVVTLLVFEGNEEKLLARLRKIMPCFPDPGDNFRFERVSPMPFHQKPKMRSFCEYIEGSDVVVVDPMRYIAPGDYYKPDVAHALINAIRSIMDTQQMSFIFCHHIKKPQPFLRIEPDDLYQLKGATEYVDAATTVLLLEHIARERDKKSGRFKTLADRDMYTLYFAKARDALNELEPMELHFNREKLMFEPITLF